MEYNASFFMLPAGNCSINQSFCRGQQPDTFSSDYIDKIIHMELIRYYSVAVITAFGLTSNMLTLIVLIFSRKLRKSVLGVLLVSLTLADIAVLASDQMISVTSSALGAKRIPAKNYVCVLANYLKYSSSSVSHLLVVCISVNRFVVVVFPLKSRIFSRINSAVIQVLSVTGISLLANVYIFCTVEVTEDDCFQINEKQSVYTAGVFTVNIFICNVLASVVVLILSVVTVHVFASSRKQVSLTDREGQVHHRKQERQVTVLLLTVAFSFLLLRTPQLIIWFPLYLSHLGHLHLSSASKMALVHGYFVTYSVYLLNYALNLYLYCITSSVFRMELYRVCTCKPELLRSESRQKSQMRSRRSTYGTEIK